jgi:multicomponent Na+:H+ antiporter subunit G
MTLYEISIAVFAFLGSVLTLIAGVGMVRMPDFYLRMSVTTKAATLGIGFFMLCAAMYFQEASVTTKVGAIVLFTFLTAPIGAHLIGRAAYILGVPMWKKSVMDDLKGQYKGSNQDLQSNSTDEAKSLLKEE